jgi:hypothetical protein
VIKCPHHFTALALDPCAAPSFGRRTGQQAQEDCPFDLTRELRLSGQRDRNLDTTDPGG